MRIDAEMISVGRELHLVSDAGATRTEAIRSHDTAENLLPAESEAEAWVEPAFSLQSGELAG